MNPQLANKYAVLYVTRDCAGSQRAVSIAQSLPEVFIQDVALLMPNQVPTWLQKSPTCVILSTRAIYTGTAVLQLLSELSDAKQNAMKEQFANAKQIPQQQIPQQTSQFMQQQYTAQMEGRLYPPQQRSAATQGILQQQSQGMTQGMTHGMTQQRAPMQQYQQPVAPQQQQNHQQQDVVRGSLQPASGTGNYGCSLDAAFAPTEQIQEQAADSRLTKPGKIDQNDIESYMRMREKSGTGQPNVLQQ